jgi:hypothetical protein
MSAHAEIMPLSCGCVVVVVMVVVGGGWVGGGGGTRPFANS